MTWVCDYNKDFGRKVEMKLELTEEQFAIVVVSLRDGFTEALDKLEAAWNTDDDTAKAIAFYSGLFEEILDEAELYLTTFMVLAKADKNHKRRKKVLAEMEQNLETAKAMRKQYELIMNNARKSQTNQN